MMALRARKATPGARRTIAANEASQWAAELLSLSRNGGMAQVAVRNTGWHGWHRGAGQARVSLLARHRRVERARVPIGDDVPASAVLYCGVELPPDMDVEELDLAIEIIATDGLRSELKLDGADASAPAHLQWRAQFTAPPGLAQYTSGARYEGVLQVRNIGQGPWEARSASGEHVTLLLQVGERALDFRLPRDVAPGEEIGIPVAFDWRRAMARSPCAPTW
jgi:hypothetical protein